METEALEEMKNRLFNIYDLVRAAQYFTDNYESQMLLHLCEYAQDELNKVMDLCQK